MDFIVTDYGSFASVHPRTALAREWIDRNVASESWQWRDDSLCVDGRFAANLVAGMVAAGFEVG